MASLASITDNAKKCPADDWELRCRFNTAQLAQRAAENEFELQAAADKHLATTPGLPPGTLAQIWYYIDRQTRLHVARVSCHYLPTGEPLPGREDPDPKMVRIGGAIYHQKAGPKINRDPSVKWPYGSAERLSYIRFRKWACKEIGPEYALEQRARRALQLRGDLGHGPWFGAAAIFLPRLHNGRPFMAEASRQFFLRDAAQFPERAQVLSEGRHGVEHSHTTRCKSNSLKDLQNVINYY